MQLNLQLRNKYLAEYWYLENEKTKVAYASGMNVQRFLQHMNHVPASHVHVFKTLLRRQLMLLRCMHIVDIVENVIFVQFRKGLL